MKLQKNENAEIRKFQKKIKDFFKNEEDLMSMVSTLLGASDNISRHIIESEMGNFNNLPYQCKYGLVQVHQVLMLFHKILTDKITPSQYKVGGYLPSKDLETWNSESDFEKRFILIIKIFYKHLKEEGKI